MSESKKSTTPAELNLKLKPYRRARRILSILAALIGAGAGYEIGWGWGAVITAALISVYFFVVVVVAVATGVFAAACETFKDSAKGGEGDE